MAPAGACSRRRAPFWMIVNSRLGPLNCSEYDSAFVITDAHEPAAGIAAGLIHASSENAEVKFSDVDDGTDTPWLDPLNLTAGFVVSAGSRLAWPRSGALRYEPLLRAFTSPAMVPDVSPSRQ